MLVLALHQRDKQFPSFSPPNYASHLPHYLEDSENPALDKTCHRLYVQGVQILVEKQTPLDASFGWATATIKKCRIKYLAKPQGQAQENGRHLSVGLRLRISIRLNRHRSMGCTSGADIRRSRVCKTSNILPESCTVSHNPRSKPPSSWSVNLACFKAPPNEDQVQTTAPRIRGSSIPNSHLSSTGIERIKCVARAGQDA